jgi:hypothetical protein
MVKLGDKKLQIIQGEIRKPCTAKTVEDWIAKKEPFVMLALVASGVKIGATLPAWFTKDELPDYEKIAEKLRLAYKAVSFIPPSIGKKRWVIDVAKDKKWLDLFEKGRLSHGEFYGYPDCCQKAYHACQRRRVKTTTYTLQWVGLYPCKPSCPKAQALALTYDAVIKSVLPQDRYRVFKNYWATKRAWAFER